MTFDSNGGSAVSSQTVDSGSTATEPTSPTRDGYTFAGWYNGSAEYSFDMPVTSNLALTAKWT
ncbi:MAG: InlB B-repeat-containing protein [Firmicutes bacterium]|nr:InlB B-repeat-containing protein [Bacillota bacterium]